MAERKMSTILVWRCSSERKTNRQGKLAKQDLLSSYDQPESLTVTTSKGCSRRIADPFLACSQQGRSVIFSGADPLSAMRHPYGGGDAVGADQPRGHTVGYHEPISGYGLGISRHSRVVSNNHIQRPLCRQQEGFSRNISFKRR